MLYRNKTTGVVISVNSELKGDWEKVIEPSPAPAVKTEKKPVRKSGKKTAGKD